MSSIESYILYYRFCVPEYAKLSECIAVAGYLDLSSDIINSTPLVTLPIASWTSKANLYSLYMKAFDYSLDKLSFDERKIIEEHYINGKALKELTDRNTNNTGTTNHTSERTLYRRKHDAEQHFIEYLAQYCLFPIY